MTLYLSYMFKLSRILFIIAALLAPIAQAHPHVFVSTRIVLDMDTSQRVTGVTMTWEYDDFFSLLIFEDMGLDRDSDGVLNSAELDQLMGFDLIEWPDGFEGDLFIFSDGQKVELVRPVPHDIAVREGKIIATQKRAIPNLPAEGLVIQQYDPTYYVSYDLNGGIEVPAPCAVRIVAADLDAAEREVERLTKQSVSGDAFMEVELGHLYASKAVLSCGG